MNPFLRYLADKNSAHTQTDRHTDRQTDRHTPMTTRPCGLRRAGNYSPKVATTVFKLNLNEHKPLSLYLSWLLLANPFFQGQPTSKTVLAVTTFGTEMFWRLEVLLDAQPTKEHNI